MVTTAQAKANECDEALAAADRVIENQSQTIQIQDAQIQTLEESLDYTMNELAKGQAWYRDPAIIGPTAFVLGIALGAYVTGGNR